ncbi:MAG: SRPBCC family protein [Oligoflexus sp.]
MSQAQFTCQIHAPFERIWRTLMDEIEHPESYNPGILGVQILERFHDGVLRSVSVPDADVREKVVYDYDKRKIQSSLVGHPSLVGILTKEIKEDETNPGCFQIESNFEWESVDEKVDMMIRRNMEAFIMRGLDQVRKKAEENEH